MGDSAWLVAMAFVSFFSPIVIVAGIVAGLVVRRWWQIVFGFAAAPGAYLLYDYAFGHHEPPMLLAVFMGLAGLVWTAAIFGFKKAWTT